jgi:hypothetical protein
MIKLKDIYAIVGKPVKLTDWVLRDEWFPEIDSTMTHIDESLEQLEEDKRLVLKELLNKNYDGERIAVMYSIWFDGRPVAVVQNAGRSGRDHAARWVTDTDAYAALLAYLLTFSRPNDTRDITDPNVELYEEEICHFYGTDFAQELGFTTEARRKDVILMGTNHGVLEGEAINSYLALLKAGAADVPEYVRRGSAVLKKQRLLPTEELMRRNPRIVESNLTDKYDRVYLYHPCERPVDAVVLSI